MKHYIIAGALIALALTGCGAKHRVPKIDEDTKALYQRIEQFHNWKQKQLPDYMQLYMSDEWEITDYKGYHFLVYDNPDRFDFGVAPDYPGENGWEVVDGEITFIIDNYTYEIMQNALVWENFESVVLHRIDGVWYLDNLLKDSEQYWLYYGEEGENAIDLNLIYGYSNK